MANICEKCNHKHICGFQDDVTLACNHFQKEVVRCKDCKHRYTLSSGMNFCKEKFPMGARDDDFCSYGERREGE